MPYADILVDVADGVNAYTPAMGHQLAEAFAACDADDPVRAIIVTGAGRGVRLEYVLAEGRAVIEDIFPDVKTPVAPIGIAEKGFVSVELTTEMEGAVVRITGGRVL